MDVRSVRGVVRPRGSVARCAAELCPYRFWRHPAEHHFVERYRRIFACLLYTSDAADE